MTFATITPTRNDRPEFDAFCRHQLERMETKPTKSYFIDYAPTGPGFDLISRVREGIRRAQADGIDLVFIVEDDDFYPKDYFNNIPDSYFIGDRKTTYYNLKNRTYQDWDHPRRASLFTTGFRISAMIDFEWPSDEDQFLDISLWRYAVNNHKQMAFRETGAIGIKHGLGLCGGKGHIQRNKYLDLEMVWLKEHTDVEAFTFYSTIKL
jgi:hypothetical protein